MPEMSVEPNFLDVKIMGREYRVACQPEERDALQAAVAMVDNKMREIAQRTKSTIAERVAVMAALNIAHERLAVPAASADETVASPDMKRRIEDMGARLDAVLVSQQQLEL
jgi:cell division protein ZapA